MGAISTVLTVIETLAKLEPEFVATWNNIKPFAADLYQQFKGRAPTEKETTALEAGVDALFERLMTPLPQE